MKADIKKMWIDALRSGKYKQGRGNLRRYDKFCCLGVLCDLYGKEKNVGWVTSRHGHSIFLEHSSGLPGEVVGWAGLPHSDTMMGNYDAVERNDGKAGGIREQSFKQIANAIERWL